MRKHLRLTCIELERGIGQSRGLCLARRSGPARGAGELGPGRRVGRINLDQAGAGASRSTAQTLLFGPGGRLFVPISNIGVDGVDTGAIRRYRRDCIPTATRTCFANFVRSGGKLGQGWHLTFGKIRAGTPAYDN